MRQRVVLCLVWMAAGGIAACAQPGAVLRDRVPTKTYVDAAGKVSFRYPVAWSLSDKYASYFPAAIAPAGEPLEAVVAFSPTGNVYAQTNLAGIDFVYRRLPGLMLEECVQGVTGRDGGASEQRAPVTIHGVVFTHLATSDAAMMKQVDEQVYVTWRQGTCFLFEEDLHTVSEGVMGTRLLTAQETAALRRHLTDVMETVRFSR